MTGYSEAPQWSDLTPEKICDELRVLTKRVRQMKAQQPSGIIIMAGEAAHATIRHTFPEDTETVKIKPFSRPNLLLLLVVPGYISWPLLCFESGQRAKKAGIWPLLHRILRTRERVKTGIWPLFPAIWPLLKPQSGQQKPSICKGLRALCPLCPLFSLN